MTDDPNDPLDPASRTVPVVIQAGAHALNGDLTVPGDATGLIVFAHGSGSGRHSPRNQQVARSLAQDGFATLLFDLLTEAEESDEGYTHQVRFDIALLADRLVGTLEWVEQQSLRTLPVGVFGADTGAAAALIAGTYVRSVGAVVSLAGRPELAADELPKVRCPTLLIVGGNDAQVLEQNRQALHQMTAPAKLQVVARAGHLFEEPGTLDEAAHHASTWFQEHLLGLPREERPHAQL